jgi:hypothetical protein
MNERIEELYKQSFIEVRDENSFPCMIFSKQKFANLLVKETISKMTQQLDTHGDNQANNPAYYKAINDTFKHFGVTQ